MIRHEDVWIEGEEASVKDSLSVQNIWLNISHEIISNRILLGGQKIKCPRKQLAQ